MGQIEVQTHLAGDPNPIALQSLTVEMTRSIYDSPQFDLHRSGNGDPKSRASEVEEALRSAMDQSFLSAT